MRILTTLFFVAFISCKSFADFDNAVTVDLDKGLGYTFFASSLWGGVSLSASENRFGDSQTLVSPRIYFNYDLVNSESADLFAGVTYSDSFGLDNDSTADKSRLLALTGGLKTSLSSNIVIAAWVNLFAKHETEIYDSSIDSRVFRASSALKAVV